MDPKACWERLLDAAHDGDFAEVCEAARDLERWRMAGGFRPNCVPASVWATGRLRDFAIVCRELVR